MRFIERREVAQLAQQALIRDSSCALRAGSGWKSTSPGIK